MTQRTGNAADEPVPAVAAVPGEGDRGECPGLTAYEVMRFAQVITVRGKVYELLLPGWEAAGEEALSLAGDTPIGYAVTPRGAASLSAPAPRVLPRSRSGAPGTRGTPAPTFPVPA